MKKIKIMIFSLFMIGLGISMPSHDGEKARMLLKWKLTEYLDISEEQGDKLLVFEYKFKLLFKAEHLL